jgi:5'(3')-deoxyribonucleotidase
MAKTLTEIQQDYNMGNYTYKVDIPNKLPDTHVFDEDLSVKKNREMVIEYNQRIADMKKEKMNRNAELSRQLTRDVVDYIIENYELSEAQACIVENYVYTEKHAFMCDYFANIDSVAEMVEAVVRLGK